MTPSEFRVWVRIQSGRILLRLLNLAEERRETWKLHRQYLADLKAGRIERTIADHYSGEIEANKWREYQSKFGQDNEITFRNRRIFDEVKSLDFTHLVNFGCLYGWLEAQVHALGKPAFGVDRAVETKKLNETEFPGPNFVAADIFGFLDAHRGGGGVFAHINTAVYFLPKFLHKLYSRIREREFRYVLVWEPSGVSRITGRFYRYSDQPQDSVVFRGPMLLHNYPYLLKQAGYKVIRQEIIRPPHPDPDFRSAFFIAERT